MMEFDALVIGGGVAGSAASLELLSAGWRVGILYRLDDVAGIESLPPDAVRKLDGLSIRIGSEFSEIIAWWGSERETHAGQVGARLVQRTVLAGALRTRAVERGAVAIKNTKLLCIERSCNSWQIGCEVAERGRRNLIAKYLIDGTGRASVIARRLGARRIFLDHLFCISATLHEPDLIGTWTESVSDGWWNLCCVREEGTLSFYSTAQGIRHAKGDFTTRLYGTTQLQHLVPTPTLGKICIRPCGSSISIPCAGPGWVAVGDAASTVQPLASAGVSKAFRDASVIQRAFEGGAKDYDRFQAAEFEVYLRQLRKQYALERRWDSTFWPGAPPRSLQSTASAQ